MNVNSKLINMEMKSKLMLHDLIPLIFYTEYIYLEGGF